MPSKIPQSPLGLVGSDPRMIDLSVIDPTVKKRLIWISNYYEWHSTQLMVL